ncbi:MAG: DNA mismatch repair endonuclease MutL [Bdellovibrionales bacterium]|nr:DNA mismatch repair endonuclease MutL [Bdellovibrionales bacterium]
MSIEILSSEVVDQISAGEVVERPAHMVKELVENSIDAGATEIEVEFAQGGRWVKIQDNGSGMDAIDLSLCLDRHATSKIKKSSDIWDLHSFGFRGEALASISAVSRVTITTRQKGSESAKQLRSEFGKRQNIVEVGGEQGTTILIEELFANTPARLKFLKSDAAEGTAIKNCLKALAMAHPQVGFRVLHKGALLYFWPSQVNKQNRVEDILERSPLYIGSGECEGFKAKVVVSGPHVTVKNSRQIWIFVQGRWVQDRGLQAAVTEGYRSLLMHGEYPYAVVWLTCPTSDVDVNIHPTKSQVKFRDSSNAFRAVHRGIRQLLETAPWLKELLPEAATPSQKTKVILGAPAKEETLQFQAQEIRRVQFAQKNETRGSDKLSEEVDSIEGMLLRSDPVQPYVKRPISLSNEITPSLEFPESSSMEVSQDSRTDWGEPQNQNSNWSSLDVLGQAHLTYIVAQSQSAIVYIDQHAAHERVVYEKLMKQWKSGSFEVQSFLLPLEIALAEEELEALVSQQEELKKIGVEFQVEEEGLSLTTAPVILKDRSLKASIEVVAQEVMEQGESFALEKSLSHIFATMACHSVVRAGQALGIEEMRSLLVQMDEFPLSSFCPHGRPVFVEYSFNRLEKDFGRKV